MVLGDAARASWGSAAVTPQWEGNENRLLSFFPLTTVTQKCWSITGGKTISSGDQLSVCASSSRHPTAHRCPVRGVIAILPGGF